MSDDPRQEIEITLGGKTYRCRPTFEKVIAIETALGQPARTLGLKCFVYAIPFTQRGPGATEIGVTEMAAILFQMLKDEEGSPGSVNEVGEMLLEEGYGQLTELVGGFLVRAQQGNREHLKEIERKAKKKSPPATGSVKAVA